MPIKSSWLKARKSWRLGNSKWWHSEVDIRERIQEVRAFRLILSCGIRLPGWWVLDLIAVGIVETLIDTRNHLKVASIRVVMAFVLLYQSKLSSPPPSNLKSTLSTTASPTPMHPQTLKRALAILSQLNNQSFNRPNTVVWLVSRKPHKKAL